MMMLSTVSARTLKDIPHIPIFPPYKLGCGDLVICVSGDAVGDKAFAAESRVHDGEETLPFSLTGKDYCAIFHQDKFKGPPSVHVAFFLDGKSVHYGNYYQNYCLLAAGNIYTGDLNAVTEKGSFPSKPGHVWIKALE